MTTKKVVNTKILSQGKQIEKVKTEWTDNPYSKPATILYKKLPDNMILITGFENFLTADEVKAKYGEEVARIYFGYTTSMDKKFTEKGDINIQVGRKQFFTVTAITVEGPAKLINDCHIVEVGDIYRKQDFSKLVGRVKKCGSLLHDIIAAVNNGPVKRITI